MHYQGYESIIEGVFFTN